jgi:thiamine-phosphate pyrophosphorylase
MLVSDGAPEGARTLPARARAAARAGVDWIQIREKHITGAELWRLAVEVGASVAGTRAGVLVNGRPDVAQAAGLAGVQLPADGLPVREVRRSFPGLVIGASCHAEDEALRAEAGGADFLLVGPVFATPGKESRALGAARFAAIVRAVRVPVMAIGGVDLASAGQAIAAGARGLAAIRLFREPPAAWEAVVRRLRGEGA